MSLNKYIYILIVGKSQWLVDNSLIHNLNKRSENKITFIVKAVSYRDFISSPKYEIIYDYIIWVGFDMKYSTRKFSDFVKTSIELPISIINNYTSLCENTHFIIIGSKARFNLFTRYGFAKQSIVSHALFQKNNVFIIDPNTISINKRIILFGLKSRLFFLLLVNFKIVKFDSDYFIIEKLVDIIINRYNPNINIKEFDFISEPTTLHSLSRINLFFLKFPRPIFVDRILSIIFLVFKKIL